MPDTRYAGIRHAAIADGLLPLSRHALLWCGSLTGWMCGGLLRYSRMSARGLRGDFVALLVAVTPG